MTTVVYSLNEDASKLQRQIDSGDEGHRAGFAFAVTKDNGDIDIYVQQVPLGVVSNWTFDTESGVLEVKITAEGDSAEFFQIYGVGEWRTVTGSRLMQVLLENSADDDDAFCLI